RWSVGLSDGSTVRLSLLVGQTHDLDMIRIERSVSSDEALRMSVADRLTEPGRALEEALKLAAQLAQFPQRCLRTDRRSAYQQWSFSLPEALANELRLGLEVIRSGETAQGAGRFAAGEGRHGSFR